MGEASATAEVFRRVVVEPAYKAVSAADRARDPRRRVAAPARRCPPSRSWPSASACTARTVREAIRQVEQEGLLQRREGRRLFVCLPGVHDLTPRATRLLLLQQTTFQELWELAVSLEPLAARLAAQRAAAAGPAARCSDNLAASQPVRRRCGDGAAGRASSMRWSAAPATTTR